MNVPSEEKSSLWTILLFYLDSMFGFPFDVHILTLI